MHGSDLIVAPLIPTRSERDLVPELNQDAVVAQFVKQSCKAGLRQLCGSFEIDAESSSMGARSLSLAITSTPSNHG
jgi:hypothetical protein